MDLPMPDNLLYLLIIFVLSLYALIRGADWLIEGASDLAHRFEVSDLVIGLTIIAFGTSLPEMVVSISAAMSGSTELAYGNVVGSNISNILLIIGCTAIVFPLTAHSDVKRDVPFYVVLTLVFLAFVLVPAWPFASDASSELGFVAGICLLGFFVAFLMRLLKSSPEDLQDMVADEIPEHQEHVSLIKVSSLILAGLAFLLGGGEFTVRSASHIAATLGVPESTIGLTIVAFGTSLPELVTSLAAAGKGKADMALGNILGSNLMNLTLVLGSAVIVQNSFIDSWGLIDAGIHTVICLVFLGLMKINRKPNISRQLGIIFILSYIAYMTFVAFRVR